MPADEGKAAASNSPPIPSETERVAGQILGMTLVTHQTGPEGRLVKKVLVEETLPIAKELYAGLVLDRAIGKVVFMASSEGGMDIEEVAAHTPEKILKEADRAGLRPYAVSSAQAGFRHRRSRAGDQLGRVVHDGAGESQ